MLSPSNLFFFKFLFSFHKMDTRQYQRITQAITSANSIESIQYILTNYNSQFNLINISALLKKLTRLKVHGDSPIINLAYEQVTPLISQIKIPNFNNSRAIANIIGFTGNLAYHGIDDWIRQLDIIYLLRIVNHKQFLMIYTGILKLGLADEIIKSQQYNKNLLESWVQKCSNYGLLISLWRNLLKANKSTKELNNLFLDKIQKVNIGFNFKDFGYLIYCYTQSYQTLNHHNVILKIIQKSSQGIARSAPINIFEYCIFVQHMVKLVEISQLSVNLQFIELLNSHYIRILKNQKIDLRSLANGFMSLISMKNFGIKTKRECYNITLLTFIEMITEQNIKVKDYQSISSIFLQLVTQCPQEEESADGKDGIKYQAKYLQMIRSVFLQPLVKFLFNKADNHLSKMNNKQFQKIIYGLYLVNKQFYPLRFSEQEKDLMIESLVNRIQLVDIQVNSLVICFKALDLFSLDVCNFFKKLIKERRIKGYEENMHKNCMFLIKKEECCWKGFNE